MNLRNDHTLGDADRERSTHRLRYTPGIGVEAGGPVMWWGDVAHDQRPTDAFSLVYDSAPLTEDLEILGLPRALLRVSADAPRANWFARISDVAPDGTVTQVAGAGFNGNHRNSARSPELLTPGEEFPLDIEMHFTSWVFPKGHRIRVAINNAQWPMLWPSPHPMTTTLAIGGADGARVVLPVVPKSDTPWPELPAAGVEPAHAGLRAARRGHALRLRRDFGGAPQPADGRRHRGRDQQRQRTPPVGYRALCGADRTQHLGRAPGRTRR